MSEETEIKNLVNEIASHVQSIKEDITYGEKANKKVKLSETETTELYTISNQLMTMSEKIGMQFIIQDFE